MTDQPTTQSDETLTSPGAWEESAAIALNYARGGSEVGRSLRQARMSRDLSIAQVAAQLRIRAGHIHDIEAGHFADLPGVAYAVGFVRAYADFVGLDGEELAKAFRDEFAAVASEPELRMPLAQTERSIPGGAVLFASLLCAVGAYAAWYFTTSESSAPNLIAGAKQRPASVAAAKPEPQPAAPFRDDAPLAAKPAGEQIAEAETATGDVSATIQAFTLPELEPESETSIEADRMADARVASEPAGARPVELEPQPEPGIALRAPPEGFAPIPDAPIPEPVVVDAAPPEQQQDVAVSSVAGQPPADQMTAAPAGTDQPAAAEAAPAPAADGVSDAEPQVAPEPPAEPVVAQSETGAETVAEPAATTTSESTAGAAAEPRSKQPARTAQTSGEPEAAVAALEPPQEAEQPPAVQDAASDQASAAESWQSRMTSPMEAQAGPIGSPATGTARIVIEVTEDCWVQVSDGADGLLLSRVLRAGESFAVPDAKGLIMDTGNAGALVLRIDGVAVTDLGAMGEVMRGLPLDPERLASASQQ